MVQDDWRLDPHARGELHTYMCGRGSGVAAVTIADAVDREAADASRGPNGSENGDLCVYAV